MNSAYIVNRGLPQHLSGPIEEYKASLSSYSINYRSENVLVAERLAVFINKNRGGSYASFNNTMADSWLSEMTNRGLTSWTIYNNLTKGAIFFDFLIRKRDATANLLRLLMPGKRPHNSSDYRDYTEFFKGVEKLYSLIYNQLESPDSLNDLAIISLLVTTPLNLKEIIQLRKNEVDLIEMKITRKGHEMLIPNRTGLILSEYDKKIKRINSKFFLIGKRGPYICYYGLKEMTFDRWSFFASSKINGQILKEYYNKIYKKSQYILHK